MNEEMIILVKDIWTVSWRLRTCGTA